jgi:RsiW-degrading membrane proteinase PrsW (M82 family)
LANESNQPVRKRSARLQAVIDLVKEEIANGKSSFEIDQTMKKYHLSKEEEAELIKDTFDLQVQAEVKNLEKQNIITKLMIGSFIFVFGIIFTFLTISSSGILFYMAIAMVFGGAWYVYKGIGEYKSL